MLYDLLHFHYDLWLWQTVSGAIACARKLKCSPNRALEAKTFSSEYWKWQHRYLMDAVEQFGPPSLFVTILPFEWTFPCPPWLENLRTKTGKSARNIPTLETLHIVHVLEQLVRGYLCGSNTQRWKNHVFSNARSKDDNVQTYFHRFEFQQRGTVHLHMLVWLEKVKAMRPNLLRADILRNDLDLAFDVCNLQPSREGALPKNDEPTSMLNLNEHEYISFFHPEEAFVKNLRGYISTVTPALKCRMDVQSTDGQGMILKYASSYVTKWHDAYDGDAMYSKHVGPYEAAYRHLKGMRPLEPEMALSLTSKKISWSKSRTKNVTVHTMKLKEPKSYEKYLKRIPECEDFSYKQWLRDFNDAPNNPKSYKGGNTLLGTKTRSVFCDD